MVENDESESSASLIATNESLSRFSNNNETNDTLCDADDMEETEAITENLYTHDLAKLCCKFLWIKLVFELIILILIFSQRLHFKSVL